MTLKIFLAIKGILGVSLLSMSFSGCMTASEHSGQVHSQTAPEMTVGIVQREIRRGMSPAEVATALGSPNIVSKDREGIQTWIYDKISSEVSYSRDEAHTGIIGLIIGGGSREAGASAQTQKTLTVILKFQDGVVHDFSYHSSKF